MQKDRGEGPAATAWFGPNDKGLLVSLIANGSSHAQLERILKALGLPFSPHALDDAKSPIRDRLHFYKTPPLPSNWFAVFIGGYSGQAPVR